MGTIILTAIVSLTISALVVYLLLQNEKNVLSTKVEVLTSQNGDMQKQVDELRKQMEMINTKALETVNRLRQECKLEMDTARAEWEDKESELRAAAKNELAEKEVKSKAETEQLLEKAMAEKEKQLNEMKESHALALENQKALFQETIEKVKRELEQTSNEMLKTRQEEFSASSKSSLDNLINPLKDKIKEMQEAFKSNAEEQTKLNASINTNMTEVIRQTEAARHSADQLTRVFKHGTKVQGDWGETVLAEILEANNLTEGIHFDVQTTLRDAAGNVIKTDDNKMMRPDVVLHMSNDRELIIDSKVSMTAYFDYVNAETEEERQVHLKNHIDSLKKHVDELAKKDYSQFIVAPKQKIDYVIMFVPNTGALMAALKEEPNLWRKSFERNVYIADEQTLYAALKIVEITWRNLQQARNQEQINKLATEILDRVGQFQKKFAQMGQQLSTLQKLYAEADNKLTPGGQSIITSCQKMEELGAKPSSRNPIRYVGTAPVDDD